MIARCDRQASGRVFLADVDVALRRADRDGGDGEPLDQRVRVVLEDETVDVRAGIAFVGVGHDIRRTGRLARGSHRSPLPAGHEPGASPPSETGLLDCIEQRLRRVSDRLFERLIATECPIAVQRRNPAECHALEDHPVRRVDLDVWPAGVRRPSRRLVAPAKAVHTRSRLNFGRFPERLDATSDEARGALAALIGEFNLGQVKERGVRDHSSTMRPRSGSNQGRRSARVGDVVALAGTAPMRIIEIESTYEGARRDGCP